MLTVYNVKQGDAMLLSGMSDASCCFDKEPLLIDCGLQKAAVHSMIGVPPKAMRVLITHADRDHIGGLYDVLANHNVSRLYVPRYLPELLRIEDYLRRKAARKAGKLQPRGATRWIEVAEGDRLCSHALVMNPPKKAARVLDGLGVESFSTRDLEDAVLALRSRGLELEVEDVTGYTPEPLGVAVAGDGNLSARGASTAQHRDRRKFFQGFFVYLDQMLQRTIDDPQVDVPSREDFDPTGNPETNRAISAALQLAANQVSIVFRYDGRKSFLFTGDADTSVFNRMSRQGHLLQADYLKVPHHGSRHNLDKKSLIAVDPKIAVVSHDNGKFARDPDSHPHMATIQLLGAHGVQTYYTNDVRKAGHVIATATRGTTSCKNLVFK
ncbi:ComEC/Rec2 family competence protein [Luteibacter rhizovicinus]|uniref:ComEC/Rec2 family competence protein n=1 Tax=Luteibacter rhizovicinus TaxID=242606 RepID=UPI0009037885|nr:MBL fold metallo-hydrolase [Luteibacter rhizovicinus]